MLDVILYYILIFIFGAITGSFLNVCIFRIPKQEEIVRTRSHCMSCNMQLRWYDMVPLVSYLFLRGRCRFCKAEISVQYPLVEAANGILYITTVWVRGMNMDSLLCCFLASALLVLSVIDSRIYVIPREINLFLLALGILRAVLDYRNFVGHLIGFFAVSAFLALLHYMTGGRAIGGGDVKLTAACGLFLGWKLMVFAFIAGCILGSVIHVIRMKVKGAGHVLALGPYLSAGVLIAALWGERILSWYLGKFAVYQ